MIGLSTEGAARTAYDVISTDWAKVMLDARRPEVDFRYKEQPPYSPIMAGRSWQLTETVLISNNADTRLVNSMQCRVRHHCTLRVLLSPFIRAIVLGCLVLLDRKLRVLCMTLSLTTGPKF